MSLLPDHMLCPAVAPWLPRLLAGARAGCFTVADFRPPRALRKLGAELPPLDADCDAALVLAPLLPAIPDALAQLLQSGTRIIELGIPTFGSALSHLRPWRRRRSAAAQAASRFAAWCELGLTHAEQWVSIDPPDTVVTMGTMKR